MRLYPVLLLVIVALLMTGCADFKTYMRDRGNDLADCFTARVGTNIGLGARLQITKYSSFSVGGAGGRKIGFFGRTKVEYDEYWIGVPLLQLIVGPFTGLFISAGGADPKGPGPADEAWGAFFRYFFTTDLRVIDSPTLPNSSCVLGVNLPDDFFYDEKSILPPPPYIRDSFFFEGSIALVVVGFDLGFNPVEFVDFLLGWTTLDITGDDAVPETEQEATP